MRHDEKNTTDKRGRGLRTASHTTEQGQEVASSDTHVVFDFTGLHKPEVSDLALILTARLLTPPHESVWVRAIHPKTARVLRALGLDHLFRSYPASDERH